MFYGSGAGKLPTASAVVADIVEIARHMDLNIAVEWSSQKLELVDFHVLVNRYFVRTKADKTAIEQVFGPVEYVLPEGVTGENGFLTEKISEAEFEAKMAQLKDVLQTIRVA